MRMTQCSNHTMKKHIALVFAASTLFLAGCCTTSHQTQWEYKTVRSIREVNELAAQGWVVVGFSGYVDTGNHDMTQFLMKHKKQ